jgi:pyruvate/2-oxoacid:ferredoxin oxidoreductase alpha subunit
VDAYLPPCLVPHRLDHDHPATIGGLMWPRESERHRLRIEEAMQRVPEVLAEARQEFVKVFGRLPDGPLVSEVAEDADLVLIATNTMAATARNVIRGRSRTGLIRIKQFRPFPRAELLRAIGPAKKIGVLDRNHSPGSGGIFWTEVAAALRERPDLVVQDYIVGIGGGDVTPRVISDIVDDLAARRASAEPVWKEVAP